MERRARLGPLAVVALAVAVAVLLGGSPAQARSWTGCPAGLGIGLVDGVRSADPRAQSYVVDRVAPGARFSRRVLVCNGSDEERTVEVYPGPAVVDSGRFQVVEGRATSELTSWIRVDRPRVVLAPRSSTTVTASFAVPRDASGGERHGVLLAAVPVRGAGQGLAVVERVGVRVYLAVGGPSVRTDFTVSSLQAVRRADGVPELRALVRNTGQRALDPAGALSLADGPGGTRAGPFPAALGTTIGPGQQGEVVVALDPALSAGPWRAELTLAAGGVDRTVTGTLTWPETAGAAPPVVAQGLSGSGGVVTLAVGLALGALALLILVLLRRRARPDPAPTSDVPGDAGPAAGIGPDSVAAASSPAPAPVSVAPSAPVPVPLPASAVPRRARPVAVLDPPDAGLSPGRATVPAPRQPGARASSAHAGSPPASPRS